MGDNRFNRPYGLWSLRADVEEIKERLMQLTNNLTPELYTLKNHREANEICQKIHEYIQDGHKVELIIRKVQTMPSFFSKDAEDGWHRLVEDVSKRVREHDLKVEVQYRYTDLLSTLLVVFLCVIIIGVIYWIGRLFLGW